MQPINQRKFWQQVMFLRRQFLQEGDLPFRNVLSAAIVLEVLNAVRVVWNDAIYTPLVTLWVFPGDRACQSRNQLYSAVGIETLFTISQLVGFVSSEFLMRYVAPHASITWNSGTKNSRTFGVWPALVGSKRTTIGNAIAEAQKARLTIRTFFIAFSLTCWP